MGKKRPGAASSRVNAYGFAISAKHLTAASLLKRSAVRRLSTGSACMSATLARSAPRRRSRQENQLTRRPSFRQPRPPLGAFAMGKKRPGAASSRASACGSAISAKNLTAASLQKCSVVRIFSKGSACMSATLARSAPRRRSRQENQLTRRPNSRRPRPLRGRCALV